MNQIHQDTFFGQCLSVPTSSFEGHLNILPILLTIPPLPVVLLIEFCLLGQEKGLEVAQGRNHDL